MAQITSRKKLEAWLNKQGRADFAQVIAARAALRVLPYALAKDVSQDWVKNFASPLFRTLAISWAARNFPAHDMVAAAVRAADAAYAAVRAADAAYAAVDAADAADAAADAADAAVRAARAAAWKNINHDCDWLETQGDHAAERLTHQALWPAGAPIGWGDAKDYAKARLDALNQGYSVWTEWYDRRVHGYKEAFDIPGDTDRAEDKAILIKLADATNEEFWDQGAAYVNTTLQGWLEEARARVKPETTDVSAIAAELAQPVSDAAPLTYTDDDEKLHIDPNARGLGLLNDDVGRKLHGEVARLARRLESAIAGGHGGNSTLDLVAENTLLIDRLGANPAEADPHLLVCSVIGVEVLLDSQPKAKNDDSDIPSFPDDVLKALKALVPIANIYLSTDPKLATIYQGRTGPGKPLVILASPAEIIAAIRDAEKKGVSGEDVTTVLSALVKTAPAKPVADDPGTLRASREAQSLVRRVTGKVVAHSKSVFKNAESIDTVAGWVSGAAKWLYEQRNLVTQVFRDRPDVMEKLRSIWDSMPWS